MQEFTVQVGTVRSRPYFVVVSATPSLNDVESFAVVLFYNCPDRGDRVQVARIDTEPFDGDVWDAQAYVEANWRRFARLHRENHED